MINAKLPQIFNFYNSSSSFIKGLYRTIVNIFTINLGEILKIWLINNKLEKFSIEEKNSFCTQQFKLAIAEALRLNQHQGQNITDQEWRNLFDKINHHQQDDFLHKKLQEITEVEVKDLIGELVQQIDFTESTTFDKFTDQVQVFLDSNPQEREKLLEIAKKIEQIAYPLTKDYFLYRYVAKAILYLNNQPNELTIVVNEPTLPLVSPLSTYEKEK